MLLFIEINFNIFKESPLSVTKTNEKKKKMKCFKNAKKI